MKEAQTHAKWIQVILARSKGKSLGKRNDPIGTKGAGVDRNDPKGIVFGKIKVALESSEPGRRLAMMGGEAIDPKAVEKHLQRSFGGDVHRVCRAFLNLANAVA